MKNKFKRLSVAVFCASLLAPLGTFAADIMIDESNFLVPTNQVLTEEWNNLGASVLGFNPATLSVSTVNETLTSLVSCN